ncbi:MAG: hypothetical protein IKS20_04940 [Victivallales bacterium]|nr:hypothetical protein [Victivallales bacterium]
MKKLGLLVVLLSFWLGMNLRAADGKYEVNVAIEAPRLTNTLAMELQKKAKVEALKKYLLRLDSNMGQDILRKACAEVDLFVDDVEKMNDKWMKIAENMGQLQGTFVVELKEAEINQWLKINGFNVQGPIELTILEEPPSGGSIKLAEGKSFLATYTNFQRRVRDCIIKKVNEFGFDVNLLADNDLYADCKDKDGELVGVFYDFETNNFVIDKKLLNAVKSNNPDTVVLYYRLETVEYSEADKQIRVTIALTLMNLNTGKRRPFGTDFFIITSNASTAALLADDIGFTAEKAINKLMNSEGAGKRLNDLAMEIKNTANVAAGPIKININGAVFDAKIRKKVLYQLKKKLVENGIAIAPKVKSTNNGIYAEAKPEFKETETLYMEKILPIIEELGLELDDDKVSYDNGRITIKP